MALSKQLQFDDSEYYSDCVVNEIAHDKDGILEIFKLPAGEYQVTKDEILSLTILRYNVPVNFLYTELFL